MGEPVIVTEHFGAGASIDRRTRTVRTDRDGLWGEHLPAGPSRRVTATYAATTRYLADQASAGRVRVKTKATLHLSRPHVREGRKVVFRGRVARLGGEDPRRRQAGRAPGQGRLEVAHRASGLLHASNGRYRMRYRFARFYTSERRLPLPDQGPPRARLALQGAGKLACETARGQGALNVMRSRASTPLRVEGANGVRIRRHLSYANVIATWRCSSPWAGVPTRSTG